MASKPQDFDVRFSSDDEQAESTVITALQREVEEARATIRRLTRELNKEQARHAQTTEAYNKTVANMVEIAQENTLLSNELERLKQARNREQHGSISLPLIPTPSEARVIRKAVARLHHPDVGGDEQRMKAWNTLLDRFENPD